MQSSNSPRFNYCWGKIQYQDKDYEFALSSLMSASKSTGPDGDSTDAPIVDPSSLTKEDQQSRCEQLIHDLAGKLEKLKTTGYGSSKSGVNQSTIFDDNDDES